VLSDLADWYVGRPLQSDADVDGFANKLRKTLDAFLLAFIPLRDGLQRAQNELVGASGSPRRDPLESAATPTQVAALLLDWSAPSDAASSVHRIFADIMVHQVSLVGSVMTGVEALLAKLAPREIEAEVAARRKLSIGPWRFSALWEEFRRRHDDYGEETSAFAIIFGPEFEKAYRQLFDEAAPRGSGGAGSRLAGIPGEHAGAPNRQVGPSGTVVAPAASRAKRGSP
jgi:hypothetical protein